MSQSSIAKGSLYLIITQIIFVGSSFIIHFSLARLLGPVLYGTYGLVISLISVLNIILSEGIGRAIAQHISSGEDAETIKRAALKLQIVVGLVLFVFYLLLSGFIAKLLGDLGLTPYLRLSALIPLTYAILAVLIGYFNGLKQLGKQAVAQITYVLSKLFLILGLTLVGFSLGGALVGFFLAPLIGSLMGFFLIDRAPGKRSPMNFAWQKLVNFTWPVVIFSAILTFFTSIDLFSVKAILKEGRLVGFYNAAITLSYLPYTVLSAISLAVFPFISASLAKNEVAMAKFYIRESIRYLALLLLPATFLIIGTAKNLIRLIYPQEYGLANVSLVILSISFCLLTVFFLLSNIIIASGRVKIPMFMALGMAIVSLALNRLLIPWAGLWGAALATTTSSLLGLLLAILYTFWRFKVLMNPQSFLRIITASALIGGISWLWKVEGIMLIMQWAVLLGFYFMLLFWWGEIKQSDKEMFKRLIPNYFKNSG